MFNNILNKIILAFICIAMISLPVNAAIKGIIAADCHGVIVKSKKWKREQEVALFVYNHWFELPMIVKIAIKLLYKRYNKEKITVARVLQEFPELEKYRENIYNFITLQEPIDEMIELLKSLKEQGYVVVLASNMAPDTFEHNKNKKPELLDFFDFHFLASDEHGSKVDDQLSYAQLFIAKNKSSYFAKLREKINDYADVTDDTEIFFIDDRIQNVQAANESNLNIRGFLPEEFRKMFCLRAISESVKHE